MNRKKKKLLQALLLATLTYSVALHGPDNPFYHDRLQWVTEHMLYLNCEGSNEFFAIYRMLHPSYMKLCDLIDEML